jgi:predicted nucleic acid-binding protein
MTMAKIAVTLPTEVRASTRLAVKRRQGMSLSAYVAKALDEMNRAGEEFDAYLDEALEQTGGPVTEEQKQRIDAILDGFERHDRDVLELMERVRARRGTIVVPAPVVGPVRRDGARQAGLGRLLQSLHTEVIPLDDPRARAAGRLCGLARTHDVIDAAVVTCAREHDLPIVTSDANDMLRLDPEVEVLPV